MGALTSEKLTVVGVIVLWVAIVVPPFVRIFQRTGRSGWWAIFMLIAPLNIIALWTLAFIRWPALERKSPASYFVERPIGRVRDDDAAIQETLSGRIGLNVAKRKIYTWRILVLRGNAKFVGTVEASNQRKAIETAKKELDIPPNEQNRLMALRSERPSKET